HLYFDLFVFFILVSHPYLISSLFPYTTLFRSFLLEAHCLLLLLIVVVLGLNLFCLAPFFCNKPFSRSLSTAPVLGTLAVPLLARSEEHTSELQSRGHLVCRLLLDKKNIIIISY